MRRGLISVAIFVAFAVIITLSRHHTGPTAPPTTAPNSSTTTSSTTTTSAGTACDASQFSGVYNEGQGAAGTIEASVTLTKSTSGTCTLKGWPLLTLSDRLGAVLKSTTDDVPTSSGGFAFLTPARANAAPRTLSLAANSSTTFSLAYSDVQSGTAACESAVTLSVQFVTNGASIAVTPQYAVQPCNAGQIWVSPFY